MVDAAALALQVNTDINMPILNDYKLFKGVVFDGAAPSSLVLDISVSDCESIADVKVSSVKADGKPLFHYAAAISFAERDAAPVQRFAIPELVKSADLSSSWYHDGTLFHGGSLQGIEAICFDDAAQTASMWARCNLPESAMAKAAGFDLTQASSQVFANDLVYQAMLIWVREQLDLAALPSSTENWRYYQSPAVNEAFYLYLHNVCVSGNSVKADISMLSETGDLLANITGCEVTASENLKQAFVRKSRNADKA